jgi:peroxiredoxin
MRNWMFLLLLILGIAGWLGGCGKNVPPPSAKPGGLQVGDKAEDFSLMDSTGRVMKSADVQEGWYIVLILYRGHWCSACLNQLLNLKEDFPKFAAIHATLAAISVDPIEDSAHFNEQWRFPYPLLSDTQFKVIDAFGARHPNGHEEKDISRPGVIILDPQRVVRYKYIGKSPVDRPEDNEILFTIQKLQQTQKP